MVISALRTILLYIIIIIAVRMMGKRQISELQTSELVITLLMSNIASIPMQDTDQSMLSGVVPILVLMACEVLLSFLMLKRAGIRRLICGKPVIVIDNGKIDQKAMKKLRLSTEDLTEQLRQKDVFDISEAAYAILETNGNLSVLKKQDNSSGQTGKSDKELSVTVISDGEISSSSLKLCGMKEQDVLNILKREKATLSDVFLMTCDKTGKYTIIRKDERK